VVLISGEAGIGKSRLMQDFATRLQSQALVLVGTGRPCAQTMPYQPITQALRSALNLERLTINVQPTWLAEASRLLPELHALYPDLPPPMQAESDEARARLFEALCRFTLGLAAGPQPVLLCLDDLHWADTATLDWLACLARRLRGSRLLVIGAYRTEEADAASELRHSLARLGILSELRLSGLDADAVLTLLRHLVGPVPGDEALADRFQKATDGNPFFLLETLRVLVEAGRLPGDPSAGSPPRVLAVAGQALADLEDLPLPDTVRRAVEARLERLSPVARQVLEAGAILSSTFGFDLVRVTAGRRELETVDSLDELVARQLLVERDTGYRFRHDLTQRVVEAGLSLIRCQLLHRRAGRALEQLEPDEVTALAYHFDTGGEGEKALHYHGLAAQRAEALFAWREAEGHQSRMLELLDQLDPDCSQPARLAQRGQVLAARAHLRYLQGRLAERDTDLASLTALAEASDDEGLRLQALAHRVRYLNLDGQHEEAITTAEEGLALADCLDHAPACSRFLAQIGLAHYFLGQPRPALAALESALTVAGEEPDPEVRGRITRILGYVHLHLGDYTRALAYRQEAHICHQVVGDHNRLAWDGLNIGFLHLKLGHFVEAKRHLTESLALARRIGAMPAEAYTLTYLGYWELYRGHYVAAADRFRQALPEQQAVHSKHGMEAAEGGLGLAHYHLGDLAEARRWLESAVERSRSLSRCRCLPEVLISLGLVELADGHPLAAHRCLTEAVAVARASECRENLAAGLAALARAERQRGNPAAALVLACEAVRVAGQITLPVCEMWGEVEAGLALFAQGKPAAALEHTGRAVALIPHANEGWISTEQVHCAHAQVLQALGQAEAANEQARRADAIVEAKASRIPNPELRQLFLQSWKRTSSGRVVG
jgi:tetratricopeptide (TPR) repeat protein